MKACVFAGSFDPVTVGHEEIIKKCMKKYDKVFLVIGKNPNKDAFFSNSERLKILTETFKDYKSVFILSYEDMKDDYAKFLENNGVKYYIRGIRNKADKRFEKKMEAINSKIYPFIKTKFIKSSKKYSHVSSTMVKELIKDGKNYLDFIPKSAKLCLNNIVKLKTL